jgi:hypothetical protein
MKQNKVEKQDKRTVTLQLDETMAGLLDAVMSSYGPSFTTPTQVARTCMETGLLRLAVVCAASPVPEIGKRVSQALAKVEKGRLTTACWEIKP